jgi:hypothetical protein
MRRRLTTAVGAAAVLGVLIAFVAVHHGRDTPSARGDRIGVHGAWQLEVRNPGGRVVAVRRFHNDLTGGANLLDRLLTAQSDPGFWEVSLLNGSDASLNACTAAYQTNAPCTMTQPGNGAIFFGGHVFQNLTVALAGGGVQLKGTAFADHAGTITTVRTALVLCSATVAAASCNSSTWQFGAGFSGRDINALTLTAGQQVMTTVTFTFTTV